MRWTSDEEIVQEFCQEAMKVSPAMERVLAHREGGVLFIWVVVDEINDDERMRLYKVENDFAVRYGYPTLIFETVWRQGRRLADLQTFPEDRIEHDCHLE